MVLTKNANVGDVITPFSSALGFAGGGGDHGRHVDAGGRGRRVGVEPGKVSVDQPCEIQLDALPDLRFRGVVQRLVPTVDRAKATVMAKVALRRTDPRILPEMSAKVAFLRKEVPADERSARTVVQPAAIVERNGRSVVFVIRDNRVPQSRFKPPAGSASWSRWSRALRPETASCSSRPASFATAQPFRCQPSRKS